MDETRTGGRGGNIAYSKAALRQAQIAGHYNEFQIQNNVQFSVDGLFYALAPADNQAFSSGHTAISACNVCVFGVWVNANNTLATTQGKIADPTKLTGTSRTGQLVVPLPDVISGNTLIGLIKVTVGTGATFTPGTTNLNATNVTAAFYDTTVMPTAPFVS